MACLNKWLPSMVNGFAGILSGTIFLFPTHKSRGIRFGLLVIAVFVALYVLMATPGHSQVSYSTGLPPDSVIVENAATGNANARSQPENTVESLLEQIMSSNRENNGPNCSPYEKVECIKPVEEFWSGSPPKAFGHVMVLNGIGLDLGIHMGMIDAAFDLGRPPELIIGSCGGSVSIGIHQAFHDKDERLEFITSTRMHDFLLNPYKPREGSERITKWQYIKVLIGSYLRNFGLINRVQNYFPFKMADIPEADFPQEFARPFGSSDHTKYIAISARTNLTPDNIEQSRIHGQKYYQEVLFTDPETGKHLTDYQSPIGVYFPKSAVAVETVVKTGYQTPQVLRAGVADPYVFAPSQLDDGYYLTGGINLNPIELAMGLGAEVTIGFRDGFDAIFNAVTQGGAFHYDTRVRQKIVSSSDPTRWVDLSDRSHWNGIGFSVTKGLTDDPKVFRETILKQYILGYLRTVESFCLPNHYKGHLRGAGGLEFNAEVLESVRESNSGNPKVCEQLEELQAKLEARYGVKTDPVTVKPMTPIHHRKRTTLTEKLKACVSALSAKVFD